MNDAPKAPFSGFLFAGGCAVALVAGSLLALVGMMTGINSGSFALGIILGVLPGAVGMSLSWRARANGFAHGVLIGSCIILLIGGICGGLGAALHGT